MVYYWLGLGHQLISALLRVTKALRAQARSFGRGLTSHQDGVLVQRWLLQIELWNNSWQVTLIGTYVLFGHANAGVARLPYVGASRVRDYRVLVELIRRVFDLGQRRGQ